MYKHYSTNYWHRPKKSWLKTVGHWLLVCIGSVLAVAILIKAATGLYGWAVKYHAQKESENIVFAVENGETVRSIGKRLEAEGFIISDTVFYLYVRLNDMGESIKAGKFLLNKTQTMPEILETLTGTATGEIVFTIPEGWTIKDIQKALTEKGLDPEKTFTACAKNPTSCGIESQTESLEGYLFPDTYFLAATNFDIPSFIALLRTTFETKVSTALAEQIATASHTFTDVIIMASIIEKEVRTDADRTIVAGILWKRLKNGWPIGADATLLYNDTDGVIDTADLAKDDPYNTRNRLGLPPTPIANPGIAAIEAALTPQESPYWFYLTDAEGTVHYATTNEQHNENKAKYL